VGLNQQTGSLIFGLKLFLDLDSRLIRQNPAPPRMMIIHLGWLKHGIIIILGGAGFCPSTVW